MTRNLIFLNSMQDYLNDKEIFLDDVLKTDPGYELPEGFTGKLAKKYENHFLWSQYIREFLVYSSVIASLLTLLVGIMYFVMSEVLTKWSSFIIENLPVVIAIIIIIAFILFADRVLLRYFSYKMKYRGS